MNKKTRLLGSVLAVLVIALGFSLWLHYKQQPRAVSTVHQLMTDKQFAASQAQIGIMTEADDLKWQQITNAVKDRGSITNPEFDWLMNGLQQPAISSDPTIAATRRLQFMLSLRQAKDYTPEQKERLYQATNSYLSAPERNDKLGALAIMRHLRDTRAIPAVTPLLNDPDALVRVSAKQTIKAINTAQ